MADAPKTEAPPPEGSTPSPPEVAEPGAVPPVEDWATRYKYLLADFENFRRRAERDREGITRQARGAMLRELLPIMEAFRSARDSVAKLPADDGVRRGLELLDREWSTFLRHEGVEPVARVGAPFQPEDSEAVGEAPATGNTADGAVLEIVQQGYRFFGGLLRPAKVIVARRSPTPAAPTAAVAEE